MPEPEKAGGKEMKIARFDRCGQALHKEDRVPSRLRHVAISQQERLFVKTEKMQEKGLRRSPFFKVILTLFRRTIPSANR